MQVRGNDRVDLEPYQLRDVAHIWYTQWRENRGTDVAPITWECSSGNFLYRLFPRDMTEAGAQKFINLRQVKEYELKITWLSIPGLK